MTLLLTSKLDLFDLFFNQEISSKDWARRKTLYLLAQEYHDKCDRFDDIVCTGIYAPTGEKVPATHWEFTEINRNASRVLREIREEAKEKGIFYVELLKAIQEFRSGVL